jgi:hypothetical protein
LKYEEQGVLEGGDPFFISYLDFIMDSGIISEEIKISEDLFCISLT